MACGEVAGYVGVVSSVQVVEEEPTGLVTGVVYVRREADCELLMGVVTGVVVSVQVVEEEPTGVVVDRRLADFELEGLVTGDELGLVTGVVVD